MILMPSVPMSTYKIRDGHDHTVDIPSLRAMGLIVSDDEVVDKECNCKLYDEWR